MNEEECLLVNDYWDKNLSRGVFVLIVFEGGQGHHALCQSIRGWCIWGRNLPLWLLPIHIPLGLLINNTRSMMMIMRWNSTVIRWSDDQTLGWSDDKMLTWWDLNGAQQAGQLKSGTLDNGNRMSWKSCAHDEGNRVLLKTKSRPIIWTRCAPIWRSCEIAFV